MGGQEVLGRRVATLAELNDAVESGLPKSTLRHVARHISSDAGEQRRIMQRVVPEATYKRRRERLSPGESERTERLARVVAMAEYVWDSQPEARHFLSTPHTELAGRTPLDVAFSELGARRVEALLHRLFYGLPV
jgi:putative toxin-antitoxin system antitoxin component (TIGR02293 family)